MDGTLIAACFALPPNSRSYCGKPGFRRAFSSFLASPSAENRRRLQEEIRLFTAHYSYLKLIARKNGLAPFDGRVAEAAWLGNPLLSEVKRKDLQRMILRNFSGPGLLSAKRAGKLAAEMPDGFVAHHTFHVLYLHTITGVIAHSVKNADSCRVSWGRVLSVRESTAKVKSQKLVKRNGRLALVPAIRTLRLSCAGIRPVPALEKGDIVACHWGVAVMRITGQQEKRLAEATRKNIAAANACVSV